MALGSNPGPNPKPGSASAVQNDDGSVTVYDEDDCYFTRSGGAGVSRCFNPGQLNSPSPGEIGVDLNGKSIFPDEETGKESFKAKMDDALRLTNASFENKLYKVAHDNNWPDPRPILDDLASQEINVDKWGGGYSTGHAGDELGNNSTLTSISTEEGKDLVVKAVMKFTGYTDNPAEQSELICPDDSSDPED